MKLADGTGKGWLIKNPFSESDIEFVQCDSGGCANQGLLTIADTRLFEVT